MKHYFTIFFFCFIFQSFDAQTDTTTVASLNYIKINYGGGMAGNYFSSQSSSNDQKESIDTLEKPTYAQSITVALSRKISEPLCFSLGFRFAKIADRTNNNAIVPLINYTNSKYRFALPLALVLQKNISKSLLYCSAGVEMSYIFLSNYKTEINNSIHKYKGAIEGNYRKSNVAGEISLGYQVPLSSKCNLNISSEYLYFITSLTKGSIKKHPYTVTLNLGLSFSLN